MKKILHLLKFILFPILTAVILLLAQQPVILKLTNCWKIERKIKAHDKNDIMIKKLDIV